MLNHTDLAHLKSRSRPVTDNTDPGHGNLSARGAAAALRGAVRLAAARHGAEVMQRACAKLALLEAWPDSIAADGAIAVILAAAEGLALVAGRENTRAALAFWASETDVAVWCAVSAAA